MTAFDRLIAHEGTWTGTSILQDPMTNAPENSGTTLTVTPIVARKFVRLDYSWTYHSTKQDGMILLGFLKSEEKITAHWIDSWHMGHRVMECAGPATETGAISVIGSYAAPPGPDWGWRITLRIADENSLKIVMFNITPEGKEDLAVEADYMRA